MRNFIDIVANTLLFEAGEPESPRRGTRTATKPKPMDFMSDLDAGGRDLANVGSRSRPPSPQSLGKKAGGSKTRRAAATAGAGMMHHPGMADAMAGMMSHGEADEISDADAARNAGMDTTLGDARPVPPTNDNLPALVNKDIALTGGRVEPEWHQVKHLPGYMLNAIRAGGRQVFRQFTDTPIEDIQMICTIPGMNPERDVKAVMAWVRTHAQPQDQAEMTFGGGIKADVRLWQSAEFSFLLVKDPMGHYVYAWVNSEGKTLSGSQSKRLK